jgi:hypothetical protein
MVSACKSVWFNGLVPRQQVHLCASQHETKPAELVRISVPDGQVQRVVELTGLTLGGLWPDWISLLPDDSPLVMLDRSTEEIYRLDFEYR